MRRPNPRDPLGFSLIELVVVIAVVALLIGLLLPVLAKARGAGEAAVCLSNMRQLATATTGYAHDHGQRLPQPSQDGDIGGSGIHNVAVRRLRGTALWFNALDYYLQQTHRDYRSGGGAADHRNLNTFKQDPVWLDLSATAPDATGRVRDNTQTIKMNAYLGYESGARRTTPDNPASAGYGRKIKFFKTLDIPQPSSTVLFVDGQGHDTPSETSGLTAYAEAFSATPAYAAARHDGGANVMHLDGAAAHQQNPTQRSGVGYRGWHLEKAGTDPELWPASRFNFRPDDFLP
ncbi:MAG: prepilin-type N-terminal cleavage/methylation domain-containing protein [Planctomycetota bacterium]